MILDPFCDCATACVAAEQLGRQWIGIDISPSAEGITKTRLQDEVDNARLDPNHPNWFNPLTAVTVSNDPPVQTKRIEMSRQMVIKDLLRSPTREYSDNELQEFWSKKHLLYGNQEGKCNGCLQPLPYRNMTIDHIKPRSETITPDNRIENLQLLCAACNSTKGNRSQEYLINRLRENRILR